ncbi:hypothetical protein NDU88_005259 [Pleurodeles waltl]|uniref:Uncharacterized protein n=1 Tax=Pleurodeles waltl TaxID=8319 RepID=A0AAV7VMU0_PLEWA|nr:hypothetical protein NDU88_005259 [Pleurodeles waltl]
MQSSRLAENGAAHDQEGPGGLYPGGGSRGGLSNSKIPQKTRQHTLESHSMGTNKEHTARHKGIPRCWKTTEEAVYRRKECWGLSCAVHEELHGRLHTSLGNCKASGARGYCLPWGGKLLPPPKLDSWTLGRSGPLQSTACGAGSTHFVRRGNPHH